MQNASNPDLKAARESAGVKTRDLADLLGVSRWTVRRWEKEPGKLPVFYVAAYLRAVDELAERPAA